MKSPTRHRLTMAVITALALSLPVVARPSVADGEAFRLLNHGAAAAGQGSAFSAQVDDPSALYYNPAGITQLPGVQLYFGTDLVSVETRFTSTSGATTRGGSDGVANPPPSFFYVTSRLKELGLTGVGDLTLGLGVLPSFGLQVRYPDDSLISTVTNSAALPLVDIKPAVAYRLTPYLALGAGLDIYTFSDLIGDGHAEQKRRAGPEFALLGIPPGAVLEINGTDTAVGFNVSALITPLRIDGKPRLNLGVVYRSPVTLDLKGDFRVDGTRVAAARVELELPWILTGAVAAWPLRDEDREWKVEIDVDYAEWSSFKDLNVKLSNGLTLPFPQNWSSTYVVMAGTEYKWLSVSGLPGWEIAARAGYIRSATPVPTKTLGPSIPDADFNLFSVGLGFLCRAPGRLFAFLPCGGERGWAPRAIGVDVAYQLVLFDARRISNNVDPRVNGRWETTGHVGSLGFRLNF